MAGALYIPGGRYTVTAAMPRARIMGTMMGAYLMIGSYIMAMTSVSVSGRFARMNYSPDTRYAELFVSP